MKTTKPTISKDELREQVKELLWQIALSDENDDEKEVDKVTALIADQQRQLLDRVEAALPGEPVLGLMDWHTRKEKGYVQCLEDVQAVINDIREGL